MGQLKTRIAELKHTLQQLVEHNVHNPDDDDHWSGVLFFCATDERTRTLVEQVEILASELFFEHPRQPFFATIAPSTTSTTNAATSGDHSTNLQDNVSRRPVSRVYEMSLRRVPEPWLKAFSKTVWLRALTTCDFSPSRRLPCARSLPEDPAWR